MKWLEELAQELLCWHRLGTIKYPARLALNTIRLKSEGKKPCNFATQSYSRRASLSSRQLLQEDRLSNLRYLRAFSSTMRDFAYQIQLKQ